jgi:hypothetical protein
VVMAEVPEPYVPATGQDPVENLSFLSKRLPLCKGETTTISETDQTVQHAPNWLVTLGLFLIDPSPSPNSCSMKWGLG